MFTIAQYGNGPDKVETWQADRAYWVNDVVRPVTENGLLYRALCNGVSYTTEPSWSTNLGSNTAERRGVLVWQAIDDFTVKLSKHSRCVKKHVTIAAGAGTMRAGQIIAMNTATYRWTFWGASASNEENVGRAILAQAVNATSREAKAVAYFTGEYYFEALYFPRWMGRSHKATAVDQLLRRGIVVDSNFIGPATTTTTSTTTTTTSSTTTTTTTV